MEFASETGKAVWHIVKRAARLAGIAALAPHDLRRTCARLCHAAGGELEQIQFLLGHVSIQTTERYLGCKTAHPIGGERQDRDRAQRTPPDKGRFADDSGSSEAMRDSRC